MGKLFFFTTIAIGFASPSWAGCVIDRYNFVFGSDTSTTAHVTNGGRCVSKLSMGRSSGIESIAVTQKAAHGTATTNGSAAYPEVDYAPAKGYKGSDAFTFTVTGGGKQHQGASNVHVAVDVQ